MQTNSLSVPSTKLLTGQLSFWSARLYRLYRSRFRSTKMLYRPTIYKTIQRLPIGLFWTMYRPTIGLSYLSKYIKTKIKHFVVPQLSKFLYGCVLRRFLLKKTIEYIKTNHWSSDLPDYSTHRPTIGHSELPNYKKTNHYSLC